MIFLKPGPNLIRKQSVFMSTPCRLRRKRGIKKDAELTPLNFLVYNRYPLKKIF
jgi:hypothetical protein